ncbi:putative WD repeat-containing protein 81 [Paratrimastix pyriformis]|uniref:WD repeat-containing protein 81 n=1 Tax=Paratrimastix pyriformis TaxID=342808 RepID=A0ABQ8UM95_9EUKA|nr:putative WD repeat-containing protein 81 [Paratrimastix pyriformis]
MEDTTIPPVFRPFFGNDGNSPTSGGIVKVLLKEGIFSSRHLEMVDPTTAKTEVNPAPVAESFTGQHRALLMSLLGRLYGAPPPFIDLASSSPEPAIAFPPGPPAAPSHPNLLAPTVLVESPRALFLFFPPIRHSLAATLRHSPHALLPPTVALRLDHALGISPPCGWGPTAQQNPSPHAALWADPFPLISDPTAPRKPASTGPAACRFALPRSDPLTEGVTAALVSQNPAAGCRTVLPLPTAIEGRAASLAMGCTRYHMMRPLFLAYQVLTALAHGHARGLVHGSVKPSNVLLLPAGPWALLTGWVGVPTIAALPPACAAALLAEGPVGSCPIPRPLHVRPALDEVTERWRCGELDNFGYLMILNRLAGRVQGDPWAHSIVPWVITFQQPLGAWRDLRQSKYRLTKGDAQLDVTYRLPPFQLVAQGARPVLPHHVSETLSEHTYFVYTARRQPIALLERHVRCPFVAQEFPASMERMYSWSPDEAIPEFYTDPTIFRSVHPDMADLQVPEWAGNSPEVFVLLHRAALESPRVSAMLHHWIDINFGYALSGLAALTHHNVPLALFTTEHRHTGPAQLFFTPHPTRGSQGLARAGVLCTQLVEGAKQAAAQALAGPPASAGVTLEPSFSPPPTSWRAPGSRPASPGVGLAADPLQAATDRDSPVYLAILRQLGATAPPRPPHVASAVPPAQQQRRPQPEAAPRPKSISEDWVDLALCRPPPSLEANAKPRQGAKSPPSSPVASDEVDLRAHIAAATATSLFSRSPHVLPAPAEPPTPVGPSASSLSVSQPPPLPSTPRRLPASADDTALDSPPPTISSSLRMRRGTISGPSPIGLGGLLSTADRIPPGADFHVAAGHVSPSRVARAVSPTLPPAEAPSRAVPADGDSPGADAFSSAADPAPPSPPSPSPPPPLGYPEWSACPEETRRRWAECHRGVHPCYRLPAEVSALHYAHQFRVLRARTATAQKPDAGPAAPPPQAAVRPQETATDPVAAPAPTPPPSPECTPEAPPAPVGTSPSPQPPPPSSAPPPPADSPPATARMVISGTEAREASELLPAERRLLMRLQQADDIFSFGCMWAEVMLDPSQRAAGLAPQAAPVMIHAQAACERVVRELGRCLPPLLAHSIARCVSIDPARRPTAGELLERGRCFPREFVPIHSFLGALRSAPTASDRVAHVLAQLPGLLTTIGAAGGFSPTMPDLLLDLVQPSLLELLTPANRCRATPRLLPILAAAFGPAGARQLIFPRVLECGAVWTLLSRPLLTRLPALFGADLVASQLGPALCAFLRDRFAPTTSASAPAPGGGSGFMSPSPSPSPGATGPAGTGWTPGMATGLGRGERARLHRTQEALAILNDALPPLLLLRHTARMLLRMAARPPVARAIDILDDGIHQEVCLAATLSLNLKVPPAFLDWGLFQNFSPL